MLLNPLSVFNKFIYHCSKNEIILKPLIDQLKNESLTYGFVIIDGNVLLLGKTCGDDKKIIFKKQIDIPTNHNKGGQSSNRFLHTHNNTCHNYLKYTIENIKKYFTCDNNLVVEGIIIAGPGEFKKHLKERLELPLLSIITTSKGDEEGFLEAIEKSSDILKNQNSSKNNKILKSFFEKIDRFDKNIIYGKDFTINAMKECMVKTLLIWDKYSEFIPKDTNIEIIIITNTSEYSNKFCYDFGGFGAILFYDVSDDFFTN